MCICKYKRTHRINLCDYVVCILYGKWHFILIQQNRNESVIMPYNVNNGNSWMMCVKWRLKDIAEMFDNKVIDFMILYCFLNATEWYLCLNEYCRYNRCISIENMRIGGCIQFTWWFIVLTQKCFLFFPFFSLTFIVNTFVTLCHIVFWIKLLHIGCWRWFNQLITQIIF